jgi:GNAT superfamily N-acetyltransferase
MNEQEDLIRLIKGFWLCHNGWNQTNEESLNDFKSWTKEGHKIYFIIYNNEKVDFVHLGSRGAEIDWLEDIFVQPEYQNMRIGTKAIEIVEDIVKHYSISLYIEAAARNERAIRLYRKLGYDCLNTISLRKDFKTDNLICLRKEKIYDESFEIRKVKKS